ncbi:hypothetical protein [Desulfosporosinus fructosivorans]
MDNDKIIKYMDMDSMIDWGKNLNMIKLLSKNKSSFIYIIVRKTLLGAAYYVQLQHPSYGT